MPDRDWSLVFFTSLSQLSIGMVLFYTCLAFFAAEPNLVIETGLSLNNPVLLALLFIGAATMASFLHLGSPLNAANALNNLSGSWLSREILALGVYSVSLLIALGSGWKLGAVEPLKFHLALSASVGLVLLWMMTRIYMVPTIPSWNTWYTPVSFFLAALSLGLLAFLCLHLAGLANIESLYDVAMKGLAVVLFLETATALVHHLRLQRMDTGIDAMVFNHGAYFLVFLLRMGLLMTSFLVLVSITFKADIYSGGLIGLVPLVVFVIAQELLGRSLFYSSYFRVGV